MAEQEGKFGVMPQPDGEVPSAAAVVGAYMDRWGIPGLTDRVSGAGWLARTADGVCPDGAGRLHILDPEWNPLISELHGIVSSVAHNAGPYYGQSDVLPIAGALAAHLFTPDLSGNIAAVLGAPDDPSVAIGRPAGYSRKPGLVHGHIEARMRTVCSIAARRAVPLVTDGTAWRVFGDEAAQEHESVPVLEWIRQDNADKSREKKYRVRKTEYRRAPSGTGWTSPDWIDVPGYWASELRRGIVSLSERTGRQLSRCRAVFVTEGGIQKGTATSGTDIDTYCFVAADRADFADIQSRLDMMYGEMIAGLPFPVQPGEALRPVYFDTVTGTPYWLYEEGDFRPMADTGQTADAIGFTVRSKEQGILVTGDGRMVIHRKPADLSDRDWFIKIGRGSLAVVEQSTVPFGPPPQQATDSSFTLDIW